MVGQINIDPAMPHAFLSYTRSDDGFLQGGISALRATLEEAVQARTGEPFRIFQDVDDIKPGDPWRKKLDQAIEAAQLFIPVLTPNFFTSGFCRREAKAFLDYEARAGRNDLVLPIYLIDSDRMDDEALRNGDELARQLHDRQYSDWRALCFKLKADETRYHVFQLAGTIAASIARTNEVDQGPLVPTAGIEEQLAALNDEIGELNNALKLERERNTELETELAGRKAEIKELSEDAAAFQGQLEEAIAAKDESSSSKKLRERLTLLDQALKKERAKTKSLTADLEASEDKVEQLTIERAVLQGDADEAKLLSQRIQRMDRQLEQKDNDLARAAEKAAADRESLLGEIALLKEGPKTSLPGTEERKRARSPLHVVEASASNLREKVANLVASIAAARITRLGLVGLLGLSAIGGSAWFYSMNSEPSPGTVFQDCDFCPEMVVIPAGEFTMGSPADEEGRLDREGPQHEVTIGSPFAIGKYEVTFEEYDRFAEATDRNLPNDERLGA